MQGWRKSNEDAHIMAPDFVPGLSLFAVFDGHGGCEVAKYCDQFFVPLLMDDEEFMKKNYKTALENTFVKIDRQLITPAGKKSLEKIGKENSPPGGFQG